MTALLLVFSTFLGQPADPFDAFFADFAEKRDGIRVLEARFSQQTVVPDEVITTQGTLLYAKPRRIVFRTEEPERVMLIDGGRGYEYEPEIQQCLVYDLEDNAQSDIFFMAFDSDTTRLRGEYDVSLFSIEDERGSQGILVRPKAGSSAEEAFVEVALYLRDSDLMPYSIRIVNDEESQLIFVVTGIQVNGAPTAEDTQILLAEGTKVVINDQVSETVSAEGKRIPEALILERPEAPSGPEAVEIKELVEPEESAPAEESDEGRTP